MNSSLYYPGIHYKKCIYTPFGKRIIPNKSPPGDPQNYLTSFALIIQIISSTFAANLPAGRQVNPTK